VKPGGSDTQALWQEFRRTRDKALRDRLILTYAPLVKYVAGKLGSWLPPRYQRVVITVWTIAVEKTGGYVISKVVLAALSAASHVLFFWVINVPFWLPLGVLAGIVGQFIPTIGTYIGVLLPALFALLDSPIKALWIALFATVYQQIENYVFTPKISKRTMDVHPAIALGSVFAGAALFGAIGAVIGIPVAAALLTIIETFRRRHQLLPELAELEEQPAEEGRGDAGRTDPNDSADDSADDSAEATPRRGESEPVYPEQRDGPDLPPEAGEDVRESAQIRARTAGGEGAPTHPVR